MEVKITIYCLRSVEPDKDTVFFHQVAIHSINFSRHNVFSPTFLENTVSQMWHDNSCCGCGTVLGGERSVCSWEACVDLITDRVGRVVTGPFN
eukprot:14025747-Ditylum_brightwellii.AAC.1